MIKAFTVSEISQYVSHVLKKESILANISVKGEVSNIGFNQGNYYFSLKDEGAAIRCIVFKYSNITLMENVKNGDEITVTGSLTTYLKGSYYQINVKKVTLEGSGELYLKFEELKKQLQQEGLFNADRKRTLPSFPHHIAVISSAKGAAIKDFMKILRQRNQWVDITIYDVNVQGNATVKDITNALNKIMRSTADLVVITRGGGSFEDLNAFNAENLVRFVSGYALPIVSAIGHEVDFTLLDFVSDVRAATPSEAAVICAPDINEHIKKLEEQSKKLENILYLRLTGELHNLQYLKERIAEMNPYHRIRMKSAELELMKVRREKEMEKRLHFEIKRLDQLRLRFASAHPKTFLERGYAIVRKDGHMIKRKAEILPGDFLNIEFVDGDVNVFADGQITQ